MQKQFVETRWCGPKDQGLRRHIGLYHVAIEYVSSYYNLGIYTFMHDKDKEGTATKFDYEVGLDDQSSD